MTYEARCRVCGDLRPQECIDVKKIEESARAHLAPGTIVTNFQFCNDRENCRAAAGRWDGYFAKSEIQVPFSIPRFS